MVVKGADLATDVLLGVAAGTKPRSMLLSARCIGPTRQPTPPPTRPTRRVSGGSIAKASCPAFSQTVTEKAAYTGVTNIQRLQLLAKTFGDQQPTQAYKLAASLMYADQNKLAGDATINTWSGQVRWI